MVFPSVTIRAEEFLTWLYGPMTAAPNIFGYVLGITKSFLLGQERGLALATKVYPTPAGKHAPEVLTKEFNTSLRELGTDGAVDIFYLHAAVLLFTLLIAPDH